MLLQKHHGPPLFSSAMAASTFFTTMHNSFNLFEDDAKDPMCAKLHVNS